MFCGSHDEKEVEFYCMEHNELCCGLCVWDHADHKSKVKICTVNDIRMHSELLSKSLGDANDYIIREVAKAKEKIADIKNNKKLTSVQELTDTI